MVPEIPKFGKKSMFEPVQLTVSGLSSTLYDDVIISIRKPGRSRYIVQAANVLYLRKHSTRSRSHSRESIGKFERPWA